MLYHTTLFPASLDHSALPGSLTEFTVVDLAVEQAHRDIPTRSSINRSVTGLLACQSVPGEVIT